MPSIHRTIWNKFHIKKRDNPPYFAWQGDRVTLTELFKDLGYKVGAEIGVYQGHYSMVICKNNPDLKMFCVDPWRAYYYYSQTSDEQQEGFFKIAQQNLEPFKNVEYVRKTSMEAVKDFKDESLDFVYIDGLHDFDNVMLDLIHWAPKVRNGGIVSGHDYITGYMVGVVPAVDTYTRQHNVNMYYITHEKTREPASFFWVKE
jgi:hypothetical protein